MKIFSIEYCRYSQCYTTYERNDWTGEMEKDEWNTRYKLFWELSLLGLRILRVKICMEEMPKYAYCAWATLGYSDWFEKHSEVDALYKKLTKGEEQ